MQKGFLLILLFNSQKSETNLTNPSFFGIINVGNPHSDQFTLHKTPRLQSLCNSFLSVASLDFGIGNGFAW